MLLLPHAVDDIPGLPYMLVTAGLLGLLYVHRFGAGSDYLVCAFAIAGGLFLLAL